MNTSSNSSQQTRTLVHQFIIDQSGSMHNSSNMVVDLFNELSQDIVQQARNSIIDNVEEQLIGLCVFNNNEIAHRLFNRNLNQFLPLAHEDYRPESSTPLYDAIGDTIQKQLAYWEGVPTEEYDVLVTILTDGRENSSVKFSADQIKELIKTHEAQNWTFTYMGAHGEVSEEIQKIAMSKKNATRFNKSKSGFDSLINKEKEARKRFINDWKQTSPSQKMHSKKDYYQN